MQNLNDASATVLSIYSEQIKIHVFYFSKENACNVNLVTCSWISLNKTSMQNKCTCNWALSTSYKAFISYYHHLSSVFFVDRPSLTIFQKYSLELRYLLDPNVVWMFLKVTYQELLWGNLTHMAAFATHRPYVPNGSFWKYLGHH